MLINFPLLCAETKSKTGSSVTVDIPGHEVRCIQKMQFVNFTSCESERSEFGRDLGSEDGPK